MKSHFLAAGAIDIKIGRAGKARIFFKQPQRLSILPESIAKAGVLFPGELDHAQLRQHDRPAEDGADREETENKLARNGGVFESKKQPAAR